MSNSTVLVILVLVLSSAHLISSLQMIRSDCASLNTIGRVVKEEYDMQNNLMRICRGEIALKECNGKCSSTLQPSFNSPNGFQKVTDTFHSDLSKVR